MVEDATLCCPQTGARPILSLPRGSDTLIGVVDRFFLRNERAALIDFHNACCTFQADQRPDCCTLLNHPLFKYEIATTKQMMELIQLVEKRQHQDRIVELHDCMFQLVDPLKCL